MSGLGIGYGDVCMSLRRRARHRWHPLRGGDGWRNAWRCAASCERYPYADHCCASDCSARRYQVTLILAIRVRPVYLSHPIQSRGKRVDAIGVEMLRLLRLEISDPVLDRPRFLVRALGHQCIEHV